MARFQTAIHHDISAFQLLLDVSRPAASNTLIKFPHVALLHYAQARYRVVVAYIIQYTSTAI